jgi:hypothetical protein
VIRDDSGSLLTHAGSEKNRVVVIEAFDLWHLTCDGIKKDI